MSEKTVSMVIGLFVISLMISLPSSISGEEADDDNILEIIFPDHTMESENEHNALAKYILTEFDLSTHNTSDYCKKEDQSRYGDLGFTTYQYNFSANCTLTLYYSSNHFASFELISEWGVNKDINENMVSIFKIIGFSDEDDYDITYQEIPILDGKREIMGYLNSSTLSNKDGYYNSNRISFRENQKGEFIKSEIMVDTWYKGNSLNNIDADRIISDFRSEFNTTKPDYLGGYISGWMSAENDNKSFLYYPEYVSVVRINLYYQHGDPNQMYQVSGYYDISNEKLLSSDVSVISNSSLYWPDEPDYPAPLQEDNDQSYDFIIYIIIIFIVSIVTIIFSFSIMAKRKSNEILDMITRKNIFEYIQNHPGSHFRKIMRDLGIKQGVLGYHTNILEHEGYIKSIQKGMYRCFYSHNSKGELSLKINNTQQKILHKVYLNPGISLTDLSEKLSRTKTLVHYHTSILNDAGLMSKEKRGRMTSFFITNIGKEYIISTSVA